ncbi:N-acetyltransferase family protein [Abiotrophia defectiva]
MTETIEIRPVQLEDAASLQKLASQELGYDYPLEACRERLQALLADNQQILLVACSQVAPKQALGIVHASYYYSFYGDPAYNVMALAVDQAYQHQGIGRLLMQALESQALLKGVHHVRLNSASHRTGAHAFYQSIGYDCYKTQKAFSKNL